MRRTSRRVSAARAAVDLLAALYPLALVLLTLVALVAPRREGAAALAQVFAHFLFLPALLIAPLALLPGMFLARLGLAAALATFLIVYPPANPLATPRPGAPDLTVMTWNLFIDGVGPAQLRAALDQHRPDVVALQEALLDDLAADEQLAAAYPYQVIDPAETAPGLAILSRYPIVEHAVPPADTAAWDMPRVVWARIDLGGRTVAVVNAHPMPPRTFGTGCPVLECYNAGPRDAQIAAVRRLADDLQRRTGDPLILAGDMNVTEREPAFLDLAAGLRDAHLEAGRGFGATWRPAPLALPFGLIRIDYLLSDAQLRPLSLQTDCAARGSDHCLLVGGFALDHTP